MSWLKKLKEKIVGPSFEELEGEESYLELDTSAVQEQKALVRPFVLESFEDIRPILDELRTGRTIAIVDIRPLRDKDLTELKRAVSKLKKTSENISGDIAGLGEDYLIITPSFASIHRSSQTPELSSEAGAG